ncbi:MAG: hypothetical protein FWC18_03575 [Cystobacterineae bacterium]|nr:hypothetical protein [Cystobacterineae bacterium]
MLLKYWAFETTSRSQKQKIETTTDSDRLRKEAIAVSHVNTKIEKTERNGHLDNAHETEEENRLP